MSMVMPASGNPPSERLGTLAHTLFTHFASHAWHGDARADSGEACSAALREPAWKRMTSHLYAHRRSTAVGGRVTVHLAEDGGRGADPAFHACAISVRRRASGEARSALDEPGAVQALRMLACRVVLAHKEAATADGDGAGEARSPGSSSSASGGIAKGAASAPLPPRPGPIGTGGGQGAAGQEAVGEAPSPQPADPNARARARRDAKLKGEKEAAEAAAAEAEAAAQRPSGQSLALATMRAEVDELVVEVLAAMMRRLGFYAPTRRLSYGLGLRASGSRSSLADDADVVSMHVAEATAAVLGSEAGAPGLGLGLGLGVGLGVSESRDPKGGGTYVQPAAPPPAIADESTAGAAGLTAVEAAAPLASAGGAQGAQGAEALPNPFEIFATVDHALRLLRSRCVPRNAPARALSTLC